MTQRRNLSQNELDLLYVAYANRGLQGNDLWDVLEDATDERWPHARFYETLGDLEDAGLVEKEPIDGRAKAVTITSDGVELLEDDLEWRLERVREQ